VRIVIGVWIILPWQCSRNIQILPIFSPIALFRGPNALHHGLRLSHFGGKRMLSEVCHANSGKDAYDDYDRHEFGE
jgi:hypothetical protein